VVLELGRVDLLMTTFMRLCCQEVVVAVVLVVLDPAVEGLFTLLAWKASSWMVLCWQMLKHPLILMLEVEVVAQFMFKHHYFLALLLDCFQRKVEAPHLETEVVGLVVSLLFISLTDLLWDPR